MKLFTWENDQFSALQCQNNLAYDCWGLRHQTPGGFAERMKLGAPHQTPGGFAASAKLGALLLDPRRGSALNPAGSSAPRPPF